MVRAMLAADGGAAGGGATAPNCGAVERPPDDGGPGGGGSTGTDSAAVLATPSAAACWRPAVSAVAPGAGAPNSVLAWAFADGDAPGVPTGAGATGTGVCARGR